MCEHSTVTGDNGEGVPPVLIPNTEVKPFSAESTWLDTARKDKSLPVFHKNALQTQCVFLYIDLSLRAVAVAKPTAGPLNFEEI